MSIQPTDPRLTAYALGELDDDQTREIEAALRDAPELEQAALEKTLEEIRQTSDLLAANLSAQPSMSLSTEQHEAIKEAAAKPPTAKQASTVPAAEKATPRKGLSRWWLIATAAGLLIAVGVGLMTDSGQQMRQSNMALATKEKRSEKTTANKKRSSGLHNKAVIQGVADRYDADEVTSKELEYELLDTTDSLSLRNGPRTPGKTGVAFVDRDDELTGNQAWIPTDDTAITGDGTIVETPTNGGQLGTTGSGPLGGGTSPTLDDRIRVFGFSLLGEENLQDITVASGLNIAGSDLDASGVTVDVETGQQGEGQGQGQGIGKGKGIGQGEGRLEQAGEGEDGPSALADQIVPEDQGFARPAKSTPPATPPAEAIAKTPPRVAKPEPVDPAKNNPAPKADPKSADPILTSAVDGGALGGNGTINIVGDIPTVRNGATLDPSVLDAKEIADEAKNRRERGQLAQGLKVAQVRRLAEERAKTSRQVLELELNIAQLREQIVNGQLPDAVQPAITAAENTDVALQTLRQKQLQLEVALQPLKGALVDRDHPKRRELRREIESARGKIDQRRAEIRKEVSVEIEKLGKDAPKKTLEQLDSQLALLRTKHAAIDKRIEEKTPAQIVARVPAVDGLVTAVSSKANLVEISVGSDDGLKREHTVDVYRNGKYLGKAQVLRTTADKSVARILKSSVRGKFKKGDRITTRFPKAKPTTLALVDNSKSMERRIEKLTRIVDRQKNVYGYFAKIVDSDRRINEHQFKRYSGVLKQQIVDGRRSVRVYEAELQKLDKNVSENDKKRLTKGLVALRGEVTKLEVAGKRLKVKGEKLRATWRRAKATPNASRLMIGDKDELPLEGMQVNVQIDGFRARVLVDYYYYNDRNQRLEGNFKLRLPNEASLYFFAFGETAHEYRPQDEKHGVRESFFSVKDVRRSGAQPDEILKLRADTWKAPKVARIVPREKAAHAYRETVRRRVDPALVEWSGAGVFAARVFPLAPKKLHRIVVGYDVNLTQVGDDMVYTLDLPEGVSDTAVDINLAAVAGKTATITPEVKPFTSNGRAYYNISRPTERRVTVRVEDVGASLLTGKDEKTGQFFAARFTPKLPKDKAAAGSEQAVLLLDTSLSSNPDKFNTYLKLLKALLEENRDSVKQFAVLCFNIEAHWWQEKFVDNTDANVKKLLAYAHTLSLEGATDLEQALREATSPSWLVATGEVVPWDVFLLSDAGLTWGERNLHVLGKRLAEGHAGALFAYNTGLSGTSLPVMSHLARESGGAVFSITSEAEIAKASRAHRTRPWQLVGMEVEGGSDLLLAGRPKTIYAGQQLTLVGRGVPKAKAPIKITLRRGKQKKTVEVTIDQRVASDLAPRSYGQVAVGQLESLGSFTEQMSVAYARHFRVTGQTCSLLMLETEADYKRFNIKPEDDEFVVKSSPTTKVITAAFKKAGNLLTDGKASFMAWLAKMEKMPGVKFRASPALKVAIDSLPSESFDVKVKPLRCKQRTWGKTDGKLREQLSLGKLDYDVLQKEAQRRMSKHSEADALRVLSSLIEHSPGNLVLARDVAYSAIEWGLSGQAYHLLHRVAVARPYEPQMYLAMAQSLSDSGHNDLALLYYEVASSGTWDGRFREFKRITAVDYVHFLRQVASGKRKTLLKDYAAARLERLDKEVKLDKSDVLITIAWNTDGTDVDLHVTEPTGEVCFYQNRKTRIGGTITQDCTQGFGPEMYTLPTARHGKYKVQVKYFAKDRNRIGTRTKVLASIYEGWGTPQERVMRKAVTLTTGKQMHDIGMVGVEK